MENRNGKSGSRQILFSWALKSLWMVKLNTLLPWKESYDQPRQCIKNQRYHFANKSQHSQSYGFSCSHVWMCELDPKEG